MSIRDSLVRVLDGKPGQEISGEALARQLGVTRTAVWKQMKALKSLGLPLESSRRHGYRFKTRFDNSLISYQGASWIHPHYQVSTASTQTLAKAGAASGLPEGHLWISEIQTKGRGRLDRLWESGYGGLWFSLLLRPTLSPRRLAPVTLLAGLCLRDAIERVTGKAAALKWPNDVMIRTADGWKKCAGILTEMSGQVEKTDWAVIGVGVNVNNPVPKDLASRAASLAAEGDRVIPRSQLLDGFLSAFHKEYAWFNKHGFGPLCTRYWKHYWTPGEPVNLQTADGLVRGRTVGVDASGAIMIESRRKTSLFHEGEIVL